MPTIGAALKQLYFRSVWSSHRVTPGISLSAAASRSRRVGYVPGVATATSPNLPPSVGGGGVSREGQDAAIGWAQARYKRTSRQRFGRAYRQNGSSINNNFFALRHRRRHGLDNRVAIGIFFANDNKARISDWHKNQPGARIKRILVRAPVPCRDSRYHLSVISIDYDELAHAGSEKSPMRPVH